jgi:hypothetical protein
MAQSPDDIIVPVIDVWSDERPDEFGTAAPLPRPEDVSFEDEEEMDAPQYAFPVDSLYADEDVDAPQYAFPVEDQPPTASDTTSAIGKGLAKGAVESTMITGPFAGARIGFAATPPVLPIVGPFAKPLGALVGAGIGAYSSYMAQEGFAESFPEYLPENINPLDTPTYEGARTTGNVIAGFPLAYGIPKMAANGVARFLSGIGEAARKYPVTFGASEIMGGIGAGAAASQAVKYAPDSPGTRFLAEAAGGVFTPGRFLVSASGNIKNYLVNKVAKGFGKPVQEDKAVRAVVNVLEDVGTDIPALVQELKKPPSLDAKGRPISVTSAQKTGDLGLTVLENFLARSNPKLGSEVMAQGQDALLAHRELLSRLRKIGDPEAFVLAAQEEKVFHEALLQKRLDAAFEQSADAIAKIKTDTPSSRQEIGEIVNKNVNKALLDARAHERTLWNRAEKASVVSKTVKGKQVLQYEKVVPTNTAETFLDIASSMTPERLSSSFPQVVSMMSRLGLDKKAIARYAQGKLTPEYLETGRVPREYLTKIVKNKPVSVVKNSNAKDLVNIRSDLLAFTRKAAASGDVADVRVFGKLAESALDDLSKVSNPAFEEARNFSRTLNDSFTRTFAGTLDDVGRTGAEKLPAEILVSRAFGSNADLTSLRMRQIEDAVGMFGKQYDDAVAQFGADSRQALDLQDYANTAAQNIVSIRDAHARTMRLAAAKSVGPDGRVNLNSLQRFTAENKPILDRLGITGDLEDIVTAENAFKALNDEFSAINRSLVQQEAFAQVVGAGSASKAVNAAIKSPNPVKSFEGLVKLAKKGDPAAVDGLKSAVYDYVFTKAGGGSTDGRINIAAFNQALFEPLQYGKPSLYNIMRTQGVFTRQEGDRLRQIIRPMMQIEDAINTNQMTSDIFTGADALSDLVMKLSGARAGSTLISRLPGGGGQLLGASEGSKAAQNMFKKLPMMQAKYILEEAAKDPQLMALLLQKAKTPQEKMVLARQLHAYLGAAGINYATFDEESVRFPEENLLIPTPTSRARRDLRAFPTANTRGSGVQPQPSAGAPAPSGNPLPLMPSSPAEPSTSRRMFQSLFPTDTISPLVE